MNSPSCSVCEDDDDAVLSLCDEIGALNENGDVVHDYSANTADHALAYGDPYGTTSTHVRRHVSFSLASSYNDQGSLLSQQVQQHELVLGKSSSNLPIIQHLQTLCKQGELDRAVDLLCDTCTSLPSSIYISLLQACSRKKSLAQAKRIHVHLAHYSPHNFDAFGVYLVVTLAKCGAVEDACLVSSRLHLRNVFSWTAIISAYVECGKPQLALNMYQSMKEDGIEPNVHTFSSLFKACANLADKQLGRKLHLEAQEMGLSTNVFVGSTLVSMYSKCGLIAEAEDAFAMMPQRDTVVWNAMLSGYIEDGQEDKVIQLYRQMLEEHVSVDNYTLMFVLQACSKLANNKISVGEQGSAKMISLEVGWAVFAYALKKGFALDDFVQTALLTMLGKCGAIGAAQHIFLTMSKRSIVLWTAMLSAYTEQGQAEMVLQMFKQFHAESLIPDPQAFVVALKACALLAERVEMKDQPTEVIALEIGRALHADACMKGYVSNILVGTALISMYGKCRAIVEAQIVFGTLPTHDAVSWTVFLSVLIECGKERKALHIYENLRKSTNLDEVTLVCILQACSERGSLEMCKYLHFDIVSSGYDQVCSLAATLIHTYASCASIEDAQAVFDRLVNPDVVPWNACIASHTAEVSINMYENMKLAGIEPNEATFTSILSACSHGGLLVKGVEYFDIMTKTYGIRPSLMHYGSLVGLLGRAGDFARVAEMLSRMPMQADLTIWLGLLRASHMHGNVELALQAFDSALNSQYDHGASYVLMSNIYAAGPEYTA